MSILFDQLCDVFEQVPGLPGRLGSDTNAMRLSLQAVPCTYLSEIEKAVNTSSAELVQVEVSMLLVPPRVVLAEQMVVRNIRHKDQSLIDAGPFVIEKFTDHHALGKVLHHRTAMLRRDFSLEIGV